MFSIFVVDESIDGVWSSIDREWGVVKGDRFEGGVYIHGGEVMGRLLIERGELQRLATQVVVPSEEAQEVE